MSKAGKTERKIFLGLGIVTVLSGISLLFSGQYLIGVSGSIVGLWLVYDNMQKLKATKSE